MIKHINDPRYEALILWLISARKERGFTVRELAKALNESHQFVNKVETMQRRLNVYEYVQYCDALELKPEDGLVFLRKTKKTKPL